MLYEAHQKQRDAWVLQMPGNSCGEGLSGSSFSVRQHQHLGRAQDRPDHLHQIHTGWAGRYRLLSDGRRQITALYLPGDVCDPCWLDGSRTIQSVVALTPLKTTRAPRRELEAQAAIDAGLEQFLWQQTRFAQQIHAEWLVNLGRKNAMERLAHLLCELYCRLSLAGHATGPSCEMPLTQLDLADLAGLTPVHVNRTLQEMRGMRMIELHSRRLTILDWPSMRRMAWFDPLYLGGNAAIEQLQVAA